jgi:hypothetical protein
MNYTSSSIWNSLTKSNKNTFCPILKTIYAMTRKLAQQNLSAKNLLSVRPKKTSSFHFSSWNHHFSKIMPVRETFVHNELRETEGEAVFENGNWCERNLSFLDELAFKSAKTHDLARVARWSIFKPKISIWVHFWRPWNGKCWYILWLLGIF